MVLDRQDAHRSWTATTLMAGDNILHMPEIDIEIPAMKVYEGIEFNADGEAIDPPTR